MTFFFFFFPFFPFLEGWAFALPEFINVSSIYDA